MPLNVPGSWQGVRNRYSQASAEVRGYFAPIENLIEAYAWEVSLAYAFARLEQAHNTMLYAGSVKVHRANPEIAKKFVDRHHLTRKGFKKLFENVFGEALPADLATTLKDAEKIRDKVLHGKTTSDAEKRAALIGVLHYAEEVNKFVNNKAGFRPFTTSRRGYTGRRKPLDNATSTWLMRGLGFIESQQDDGEN